VTIETDLITTVATDAIGPCRLVSDLSWPHGESWVVELETADGGRIIGKAYRQAGKFAAEHNAYRRWVPSLEPHAPRLLAADTASHVLVMSMLEAQALSTVPTLDHDDVHRQAGSLLARFHGAERQLRITGYAERERARFGAWVERAAPGVLHYDEIDFIDRQLRALDDVDDPMAVPCHRDWQPRNWLIGQDSAVSVIDFEHARPGPWFEDLTRLWWAEWMEQPGLAEAFFDGYGRTLDADERRAFIAISLLGHLVTIVWAHEHDDRAYGEFARRCLAQAMQGTGPR
jgi:Ser/Thr protein kinase RdoA (MazF antagonist)